MSDEQNMSKYLHEGPGYENGHCSCSFQVSASFSPELDYCSRVGDVKTLHRHIGTSVPSTCTYPGAQLQAERERETA